MSLIEVTAFVSELRQFRATMRIYVMAIFRNRLRRANVFGVVLTARGNFLSNCFLERPTHRPISALRIIERP